MSEGLRAPPTGQHHDCYWAKRIGTRRKLCSLANKLPQEATLLFFTVPSHHVSFPSVFFSSTALLFIHGPHSQHISCSSSILLTDKTTASSAEATLRAAGLLVYLTWMFGANVESSTVRHVPALGSLEHYSRSGLLYMHTNIPRYCYPEFQILLFCN